MEKHISHSRRRGLHPASLLAAAALACGCASHPTPQLQMSASRMAIMSAESPSDSPGMGLATEKIALAERLAAAGSNEAARWLAEQAQVDAELARAQHLAARAVEKAALHETSVRTLRAQFVVSANNAR